MDAFIRAIKTTTGKNIGEFAKQTLGISKELFYYRKRQGTFRLEDYHKILRATGMTFEELFPNPLAPPKFLQTVVIPPVAGPSARITPPAVKKPRQEKKVVPPPVSPAPAKEIPPPQSERQYNEEAPAELPDLDIYEGSDLDVNSPAPSEDPKVDWAPVAPPAKKK